jgi:hypothetical protein
MILLAFGPDGEVVCYPGAMTDVEMVELARGLQKFAARLVENPGITRRMAGNGGRR